MMYTLQHKATPLGNWGNMIEEHATLEAAIKAGAGFGDMGIFRVLDSQKQPVHYGPNHFVCRIPTLHRWSIHYAIKVSGIDRPVAIIDKEAHLQNPPAWGPAQVIIAINTLPDSRYVDLVALALMDAFAVARELDQMYPVGKPVRDTKSSFT